MSEKSRADILIERYDPRPKGVRMLRSQAKRVIKEAEREGLLDDEDGFAQLIADFAKNRNVDLPTLASFVFREAMYSGKL